MAATTSETTRIARPARTETAVDPITVSVVRSALEQICDEMDLHTIRSAISPIISETNDCAHGIYHPRTGETIAQGHLGLPIFLVVMQFTVQAVIAKARERGGFREGDVWILNDTYLGGTHLNDVTLVRPVFADGELFALLANTGHWMDVGGPSPGGWNPEATEIHQEGIVLPPMLLEEDGRRNGALVETILANVRLPREISGDLLALSSALGRSEQRLRALLTRYGSPAVHACLDELIERSELQMRSHIDEIPDGRYEWTELLDNDGVVDQPLEVRVAIEVEGSDLRIDFAGSSPAARGPVNISRNTTISTCHVALKHIFPDVPVNGGTFRPVHIAVPEGSVLHARYPSPTTGYMEIVGRVLDGVLAVLGQAMPATVPAAPFGTTGPLTISGRQPDRDGYFVGVFPYAGGYGATPGGDGLVHGNTPQSMANFVALEASEHRYPLRFELFALREGSGGAGMHRGGDGTTYRIEVTADCVSSLNADRGDHVPFGLHGGHPGAANVVRLRTDGEEHIPPMRTKFARRALRAGDSIFTASPGGGGFGDPFARPLDLVERDLNFGYVDEDAAQRDYGVVIASRRKVAGRGRYELDCQGSERRRFERNG